MRTPRALTIGTILVGVDLTIGTSPLASAQGNQDSERRNRLERGRQLAARHCAECHLEPAPDLLPKRSWQTSLGYMGLLLGMQNLDYLDGQPAMARETVVARQGVLVREGALPDMPALTESEWDALRHYYVESAPPEALPQAGKPELRWELPRFRVAESDYYVPGAVTTLVHIRPGAGEAYIGDSALNTLTVLGPDGRIKIAGQRPPTEIFPIDIEFIGGTAYVGSIGDLEARRPTEERSAHISTLELVGDSIESAPAAIIVPNLYRMADMEPADLNGDGRLDFVVCGFGHVTGRISWFEARADGSYEEHVLVPRAGGVKAQAVDFNGDGLLDIAVLVSEAREAFYIFVNQGNNEFERHDVFETQPAYGHTYFELQDFDDDGLLDLLVVNGDNVDSDPYNTRKRYHGVRIYLNRGGYRFEEAYFYPLHGAFIGKSADFDNDGDLDIAAISYFPDFSAAQRESFVYLENQGDLQFTASTSRELMRGRWMTMDVGDLDGDGDVDVVLGGAYLQLGMVAHLDLFAELRKTGPSVLLLENTLN